MMDWITMRGMASGSVHAAPLKAIAQCSRGRSGSRTRTSDPVKYVGLWSQPCAASLSIGTPQRILKQYLIDVHFHLVESDVQELGEHARRALGRGGPQLTQFHHTHPPPVSEEEMC